MTTVVQIDQWTHGSVQKKKLINMSKDSGMAGESSVSLTSVAKP